MATVLWGSLRYEALIALRTRSLWLAMVPLTLLAALLAVISPAATDGGVVERVGIVLLVINSFATLGVGIALAGRMRSASLPGLNDVLNATPSSPGLRTTGALAGPIGVAVAPLALVSVVAGAVIGLLEGEPAAFGAAVLGVLTMIFPAALALAALAGLLGQVMPVAAARVVVLVVWFWSTHLDPDLVPVPTVAGTVLSPLGGYQAASWFGVDPIWADRDRSGLLSPEPGTAAALTGVLAVLLLAVVLQTLSRLLSVHGERLRTAAPRPVRKEV